ncbi:MAG TPA: FtsW/RodA/SpoVE family cell cycle protein [Capillimicrobium sp.]|nr:FtsW/RodA/SpoVE family cell cycle protein [Capillimicrobium sp.]
MNTAASPIRDPRDDAPVAATGGGLLSLRLPFDPLLLVATIGLLVCSLVVLDGATAEDIAGQPDYFVNRQAIFSAVGVVLMLVLSRIDVSRFRELTWGLYAVLIGIILLNLALGSEVRGAQLAIQLPGGFNFQSSEFGKVLLILVLAGFVVGRSRRIADRDTTARVMLLALVPAFFVIAQPDLGSGMVYVVIALAVLFVAGTPWRHFAGLFALIAVAITVALVAAPAVGVEVLKPYQVDRLTSFLSPSDVAGDEGYQQEQSKIAIGAGQKTGRGDQATQTKLNFLPEHHTDFIFAVVGERYGFVGCALVLSLYALLIWRSLRILTMAKNLFGALVAGGVVAMLMFQVFVNVGMNLGIMPITGLTLPLLSYGPASVITTLLALGLLQSIYVQGRLAAAYKSRTIL